MILTRILIFYFLPYEPGTLRNLVFLSISGSYSVLASHLHCIQKIPFKGTRVFYGFFVMIRVMDKHDFYINNRRNVLKNQTNHRSDCGEKAFKNTSLSCNMFVSSQCPPMSVAVLYLHQHCIVCKDIKKSESFTRTYKRVYRL